MAENANALNFGGWHLETWLLHRFQSGLSGKTEP